MHTFRKLPNVSPKKNAANAKKGSNDPSRFLSAILPWICLDYKAPMPGNPKVPKGMYFQANTSRMFDLDSIAGLLRNLISYRNQQSTLWIAAIVHGRVVQAKVVKSSALINSDLNANPCEPLSQGDSLTFENSCAHTDPDCRRRRHHPPADPPFAGSGRRLAGLRRGEQWRGCRRQERESAPRPHRHGSGHAQHERAGGGTPDFLCATLHPYAAADGATALDPTGAGSAEGRVSRRGLQEYGRRGHPRSRCAAARASLFSGRRLTRRVSRRVQNVSGEVHDQE